MQWNDFYCIQNVDRVCSWRLLSKNCLFSHFSLILTDRWVSEWVIWNAGDQPFKESAFEEHKNKSYENCGKKEFCEERKFKEMVDALADPLTDYFGRQLLHWIVSYSNTWYSTLSGELVDNIKSLESGVAVIDHILSPKEEESETTQNLGAFMNGDYMIRNNLYNQNNGNNQYIQMPLENDEGLLRRGNIRRCKYYLLRLRFQINSSAS